MEFIRKLAMNRFGILVTSDYVLDETLTLIRKRSGARAAVSFLDKITKTQSLSLVWIERDVFDKAADLFRNSDERQVWSFTDCTSFIIMKELGIRDAYCFDSDFRNAGFHVLP